jgi:hypothetical protein
VAVLGEGGGKKNPLLISPMEWGKNRPSQNMAGVFAFGEREGFWTLGFVTTTAEVQNDRGRARQGGF